MGGYDLYGNYYHREIDAVNAEMAQCADIDRQIQAKQIKELQQQIAALQEVKTEMEKK